MSDRPEELHRWQVYSSYPWAPSVCSKIDVFCVSKAVCYITRAVETQDANFKLLIYLAQATYLIRTEDCAESPGRQDSLG